MSLVSSLPSSLLRSHPLLCKRKLCCLRTFRKDETNRSCKPAALRAFRFPDPLIHITQIDEIRNDALPGLPHPLGMINPIGDVADNTFQLVYIFILLGLSATGIYLVARQALIRRELDESAKSLGEVIRSGKGTGEEYFELAAVLIRKKLFTQAVKNLKKSIATWSGNEYDLAQVHNALGFCYSKTSRVEEAVSEYNKAVKLQPGYVTAWNNLGDAYEELKDLKQAYAAYKETLFLAPENKVAQQRAEYLKGRIERLRL